MDAAGALADLMGLGGEVEHAIVLEDEAVLASTLGPERAAALALAVRDLVVTAERLKPGRPAPLRRLHARAGPGAVSIVRGERLTVAAVTGPEPSAALVAHDLRTLLRRLEEAPAGAESEAGARA